MHTYTLRYDVLIHRVKVVTSHLSPEDYYDSIVDKEGNCSIEIDIITDSVELYENDLLAICM